MKDEKNVTNSSTQNEVNEVNVVDENVENEMEIKDEINETPDDFSKYKEFLAETDEEDLEEEIQEPFFYKIIMIVAALVFLITVGVMTWSYLDVQSERKNALERLSMQKGEAVKLTKTEKKSDKKEKNKKLTVAEAQKQMKKPFERLEEHVMATDEMSEKFLKDPEIAYTTEWKMDYQSHMKEIREANAELQTIIANTEDDVYKNYGQMFNKVVEFTSVRYEAIVEKDQEKLIHASTLVEEFQEDLPDAIKWFE